MAWILLIVAIVFKVAGTANMKLAEDFTRLWPSVLLLASIGLIVIGVIGLNLGETSD
jgi:multidrug transporter EmrE-like cation transporter